MINSAVITEGLKKAYPALTHRNFRFFWFGQCISLIGTWMQTTALQWLVYSTTKSAFLLGLLGVAQFGPVMCLSLFAGVYVDRYPKKRIIIFTQILLMIQALALAFLVWLGHIAYWQVFVLALFFGFVYTLDIPARQSFISELVDRKDLRSAIGLNSAIFNVARMVGPAISAILLNQFGTGPLFLFNGLSFIPVIILLYKINTKTTVIEKAEKKVFIEILEGLNYIRNSRILLSVLLSMLIVGTFVMNFNVIIPLYAVEVLKQGVQGYGFLMSAFGAGASVGALFVASRANGKSGLQIIFGSALLASVLLILLNFINIFSLAILLHVIFGFVSIVFIITVNSTIQLNTSNQFRGRVMSFYSFALIGSTPIGNLFTGSITEKLGPGMGFLICGTLSGLLVILTISVVLFKRRTQQT